MFFCHHNRVLSQYEWKMDKYYCSMQKDSDYPANINKVLCFGYHLEIRNKIQFLNSFHGVSLHKI